MRLRVRGGLRFILVSVCLVAMAVPWVASRAQNYTSPWTNLTAGGILPLPPPPPQGAFFEVIFANPKWMVVQNQRGQQFPVAVDAVGQFLIRWPAEYRDLSPAVLVEAIGPELASMTIQTDHIDLFMGSDQSLVQPGYASILPINKPVIAIDPTFGRNIVGFDIAAANQLYAWVYPVSPGTSGIPNQMHAVGNALNRNPLRLGVPGNNFVTVLPSNPGTLTITQVTRGNVGFAKKGDFAYLTPIQGGNPVGEKTLYLSRVVLYKKIRRDQFIP